MEFIIFLIIVFWVIRKNKAKVQSEAEAKQKQLINSNTSVFNNNSANTITGNKVGGFTTTTTRSANNQSMAGTVNRATTASSNSKYDNNMTMYASKASDDNKNRAKDYENCFKTYRYTEIRDIAAVLNVSESRVVKDIKKYQQMGYFKDIKVDIKNRQIIYNSTINAAASKTKSQTVDEDRYKYINKEPNETYNYVNKDNKEDYTYVNKTRKEDYNYVNKEQKEDYNYVNKKKAEYDADKEYVRKQHELHTSEDEHWEKDSVEEEAINLDVEFGTFSSYDFNSFDFIHSFNSFDYLPDMYNELNVEKMLEEV